MKAARLAVTVLAAILVVGCVAGSLLPRFDYAAQDREQVNAGSSIQHWLGTDDLGRDRFARLLHGTRVSMLLAPAAACISILLALTMGAAPGFLGGLSERAAKSIIDLFLSVPWLFLLLTVRAMLPLNTSPTVSVTITFLMLGTLGWAAPARILLARARAMRQSDFILMARSSGVSPFRLLGKHVLPNLQPILLAQFWIAVPVFVLAEANLSLLGLGVAEPLPSLGGLLRELETVISFRGDLCRFAALIMLVLIVSGMQLAVMEGEVLMRRTFLYLCLLLTLLVTAAACLDELKFYLRSEPKSFNPALVADDSSETIRYLTGGVLIRLNRESQKLEPELAKAWSVSKNGTTITFTLRKAVSFSDGTPFGADDVKYTMDQLMDPALHSPTGDAFRSTTGKVISTVSAPDKISITFPAAVAGLDKLFDQVAIVSAHSPQKQMAVLGPYYVSEYKAGSYVELRRNPNYWKRDASGRQLPYIDAVKLEIQSNREIELLKFTRDDIQLINSMDADSFDRLSRSSPERVRDAGPSLDSEQIWFNQTPNSPLLWYEREWFGSRNFRRAISSAINRKDLCKVVYNGHARPALGPVSPANKFWFDSHLQPVRFDPGAALQLLQQDGFQLSGGVLHDRNGHAVAFSIVTNAGNRSRERMATMIQQDLRALGITVNVVTLDFPSLIQRLSETFDYEAALLGLVNVDLDPNAQMNVWLSSSDEHQWNPRQKMPATAWEAEIDRLMRAQASTMDNRARKKYFDRVQEIVSDQLPFIYLVNKNALTGISPLLEGARPVVLRPQTYWNIERLSFASERAGNGK